MKTVAAFFLFALSCTMLNAQSSSVVGDTAVSTSGDIPSIYKNDKVVTDTSASRMLKRETTVYKLFPNYIYKDVKPEGYQVSIYGMFLGNMYKYIYMVNTTEDYAAYSANWENDSIVLVVLTKVKGPEERAFLIQLPPSKGGTLIVLKEITNENEISAERKKCWPYPLPQKSNPVKSK